MLEGFTFVCTLEIMVLDTYTSVRRRCGYREPTRRRHVTLADRKDCVRPGNAKRSDVRWVLETAAEQFWVHVAAWEATHA